MFTNKIGIYIGRIVIVFDMLFDFSNSECFICKRVNIADILVTNTYHNLKSRSIIFSSINAL
jgi:hypothetical protein